MKVISCWDCNKKQKDFCRKHGVEKNTVPCSFVLMQDYETALDKLEGNEK